MDNASGWSSTRSGSIPKIIPSGQHERSPGDIPIHNKLIPFENQIHQRNMILWWYTHLLQLHRVIHGSYPGDTHNLGNVKKWTTEDHRNNSKPVKRPARDANPHCMIPSAMVEQGFYDDDHADTRSEMEILDCGNLERFLVFRSWNMGKHRWIRGECHGEVGDSMASSSGSCVTWEGEEQETAGCWFWSFVARWTGGDYHHRQVIDLL